MNREIVKSSTPVAPITPGQGSSNFNVDQNVIIETIKEIFGKDSDGINFNQNPKNFIKDITRRIEESGKLGNPGEFSKIFNSIINSEVINKLGNLTDEERKDYERKIRKSIRQAKKREEKRKRKSNRKE